MTNLFSIFDPSTSIFELKMNWMTTIIVMMLLPTSFWLMNNRYSMMWTKPINILHNEFNTLLNNKNKSMSMMFITLFTLIMLNNLMSLFPYIFTVTSHLSTTLTLALPLWLTLMLYGWMINTENMFMHLVPTGTPTVLMPFMVCIETISNIIRPMTLSVRLAANMIAGHLIMTLLGNTAMMMTMNTLMVMLMIQMLLLMLEAAVAIIQGYVFAVLMTLYTSEVN
uniref:ATP synthase subunit a n=1 Tax=Megacrania alpheus adan TaxID=590997 RepID=E2RV52_9NEOP|nr:ATP synthase F0 subunit 6 [Megacrania alpheus adan]BAJ24586.1 ATP synthase F0 subunit 6 [Megacrania alpheus adan]